VQGNGNGLLYWPPVEAQCAKDRQAGLSYFLAVGILITKYYLAPAITLAFPDLAAF